MAISEYKAFMKLLIKSPRRKVDRIAYWTKEGSTKTGEGLITKYAVKFKKKYNEGSFWRKVGSYAKKASKEVIEKALILYYCLQDDDTPAWAKSAILGVLGYFISPIDMILDVTPVIGFSDDIGVITMATVVVAASIKKEHRDKAKEKLEEKLKDWFG